VLLVIPSGSAAVTYTLLAAMAGVLVSPVAGAIADRADNRVHCGVRRGTERLSFGVTLSIGRSQFKISVG
jgi:hypothetical protein